MNGRRLIAQTAWAVALVNLAVVLAGPAAAGESSEALMRKFAEFPGADRGQVIDIVGDAVAHSFPGYRFSVLRFRQYPVALVPPAPLKANNLFAAAPDGAVACPATRAAMLSAEAKYRPSCSKAVPASIPTRTPGKIGSRSTKSRR